MGKHAARTAQNLSAQTAAAVHLAHEIRQITDDNDAIRDTIEGETGLHEAIGAVMGLIWEDELLIGGIDKMLESLSARKKRLEERISSYRGAIERAMEAGELHRFELPEATLSLRRVPPSVRIVDESKIPAAYWVTPEPRLDKRAVADALKGDFDVPGAELSNGGVTLSVRRA